MVAPAQYDPIAPSYFDRVGICGYGCGYRYQQFRGTRLRGHPWCLVELGADLLALIDRFPQATYVRLAADLGLPTRMVTKIIQFAMLRRSREATGPRRPTPLSPRQREILALITAYWREVEALPDYLTLSHLAAIGLSTAGGYLSHLRFHGWISRRSVLHVPGCGVECRDGCPTQAGAR